MGRSIHALPIARRRSRRRFLTLVGLALLSGCVPFSRWCEQNPPPPYRRFFYLSLDERHRAILTYPIEDQIDLYLYNVRCMHPPDLYLAYDIARSGEAAVPALLKRLRTTQRQSEQYHIIYVFEAMANFYYPVKDDEQAMATLREAVAAMRDPLSKERSEKSLAVIEKGQGHR